MNPNKIGYKALLIAVIFSLLFFVSGVFCPFFHITKFWLWKEDVSVYSSVVSLFQNKEYLLGLLVLIFSILFPLIKYTLLLYVIIKKKAPKIFVFVKFGKFSMTEVFSLAIFIVVIKSSGLNYIKVNIMFGAYFFVASVITSLIISEIVEKTIKNKYVSVSSANK